MGRNAHTHRYEDRTPADQVWRDAVTAALQREYRDGEAEDFRLCGHPDTFFSYCVCSHDHAHFARPIPHLCRKRYCPECAWRESARLLKRYTPHIRRIVRYGNPRYRLRHIVLTTGFSLRDPDANQQYRKMWECVSKLFDLLLGDDWTKKGQGYFAGSEFGEDGQKLHFHVLFWGQFIKKHTLSDVWEKLTGWKITYIREVNDPIKSAKEVFKYCAKLTSIAPQDVPLLSEVLKGSRRVRSRGIFYNLPIEVEQPATCPDCGAKLDIIPKSVYESWKVANDEMYLDVEALATADILDLRLGNKSPPIQQELAGFDGTIHNFGYD